MFLEYIKNTERKKFTRGATPCPRGWGRALPPWAPPTSWAPWWPSDVHLLLYEVFRWGKNHKPSPRTKLRCHEAEPWRDQSRALAELFCRGNFPPRGGNHRLVITNAPLIGRGQSPSTSSPVPSPLKTLVHLLYPIPMSKSGIGTYGLLVVLITPCSWCYLV